MPLEPFTNDAEVERIVRLFHERRLPRPEWTHRAHLCVALWHLCSKDGAEVLDTLREGICAYNVASGVPNTETRGYHETLTRFWVRTAARFYETADKSLLLYVLSNRLYAAFGDADLPLRHWHRDALMSPPARRAWLEPDKEPLP